MSASDPPAPGADDWNHEATSIAHHEERTDTDFTVNRNQQETSVNTNNHHPEPEEVDDSENNYNDPFFVYRGGNQRIPADVAMVRIDPSVTVIPSSAFAGCAFLTIVEMHPQVTAIEALAFSSCASLEQIHLIATHWRSGLFLLFRTESCRTALVVGISGRTRLFEFGIGDGAIRGRIAHIIIGRLRTKEAYDMGSRSL